MSELYQRALRKLRTHHERLGYRPVATQLSNLRVLLWRGWDELADELTIVRFSMPHPFLDDADRFARVLLVREEMRAFRWIEEGPPRTDGRARWWAVWYALPLANDLRLACAPRVEIPPGARHFDAHQLGQTIGAHDGQWRPRRGQRLIRCE